MNGRRLVSNEAEHSGDGDRKVREQVNEKSTSGDVLGRLLGPPLFMKGTARHVLEETGALPFIHFQSFLFLFLNECSDPLSLIFAFVSHPQIKVVLVKKSHGKPMFML